MEQEIREQSTEVQGTTTVSTIYSVGLHELQNIQKQLLKTHPKVNMRLNYRRNDQVYDDVILGAAEIGIVAYPQPRAGVDIHPFREDRLAVVCAPNHPFASKAKVSLTALSGVPFIAFDREAPTRKALDRLFREKNLDLNPVMEMDNVETIKRAVEMGIGVAILPSSTVAAEVAQGSARRQALRRGPGVAAHRAAHPQGQVPGPRVRRGARGLQARRGHERRALKRPGTGSRPRAAPCGWHGAFSLLRRRSRHPGRAPARAARASAAGRTRRGG